MELIIIFLVLREFEYKINLDIVFNLTICIDKSPDYSTFSLRINKIEKFIYNGLYTLLVEHINPDIRICAIDSTAIRSSKFDKDAKIEKGIRLAFFKRYKLHLIITVTDKIILITNIHLYSYQQFYPHTICVFFNALKYFSTDC